MARVAIEIPFRKKICGIDSERFSLFRGKSASFAEFRVFRNSPFRGSEPNGTKICEKMSFGVTANITTTKNQLFSLNSYSCLEWLGTEFRAFSVPRNRRNSDGLNQNLGLFRLPRKKIFLRKWQP
jgi:hypothetical protein